MMSHRSLWSLLLVFSLTFLAGCGDEDEVENPEGVNEQEVITTINLTFTPMGGGDAVTAQVLDAAQVRNVFRPLLEILARSRSQLFELLTFLSSRHWFGPSVMRNHIRMYS